MATNYTFPDIAAPILPRAENGSSSFGEKLSDSTIESICDGGYKLTRPRHTRVTGTWTFAWNALSTEDYKKIRGFYEKVQNSMSFTWTNPLDGETYTVRFTGNWSWIYDFPVGWRGTLTFEEV